MRKSFTDTKERNASRKLWVILVLVWFFLITASIYRVVNYTSGYGSIPVMVATLTVRWTLVTLSVFVFYRLIRGIHRRKYSPLVHLPLSLLSVPVVSIVFTLPEMFLQSGLSFTADAYVEAGIFNLRFLVIVVPVLYGLALGFHYYKINYQTYIQEKIKEEQIGMDVIEAKLAVFRSQLDPHFLFNTLQGIITLIGQDQLKARETLGYLRKILEKMKERKDVMKVELREEMEIVGYYLKIEKIRYQDLLEIEQDLGDETLDALVPTFSLQLLIENAIKHGISKSSEKGLVRIRSRVSQNGEEHLKVAIENTAKYLELETMKEGTEGIGLGNIKSRLKRMYEHSEFQITKSPLGGPKVQFSIPYEKKNERI